MLLLTVALMVSTLGCTPPNKPQFSELTAWQKSNIVSDIIAGVDKTAAISPAQSCSILECATVLASYGLDVVPQGDKWENKFHWSPPLCGPIPTYYIVEIRYATSDTNAFYTLKNAAGPHSIHVAGVHSPTQRMSFFSTETFKPDTAPLHGISHDTPSLPCNQGTSIKLK